MGSILKVKGERMLRYITSISAMVLLAFNISEREKFWMIIMS